jgi:hypothetical protein
VRFLFSSTGGAGHYGPLAPFVRSCLDGGHDVLVAGPSGLVVPPGVPFHEVDAPAPDAMAAAFQRLAGMSHDEGNAWIIGEVFARLDATAALPGLCAAITEWRPDLVVRESAEFGAAVAADLLGVRHVRVAIGLDAMEEQVIGLAAPNVSALRTAQGLPPDPDGRALRATAYYSLFPAGLEDGYVPGVRRFRDPAWPPLSRYVGRPFVYVSFGSVAGGMAELAGVYAAAIAAVAGLDADVLLTVGRGADPVTLGPPPRNVRIERWADQSDVLGRAAAVVCHGGGGTTLGALAAGVPLVVVPLFASDQHVNARRVTEVGAGRTATPDAEAIRAALEAVLADEGYRRRAEALATELAGQPSTDAFPSRAVQVGTVNR